VKLMRDARNRQAASNALCGWKAWMSPPSNTLSELCLTGGVFLHCQVYLLSVLKVVKAVKLMRDARNRHAASNALCAVCVCVSV